MNDLIIAVIEMNDGQFTILVVQIATLISSFIAGLFVWLRNRDQGKLQILREEREAAKELREEAKLLREDLEKREDKRLLAEEKKKKSENV